MSDLLSQKFGKASPSPQYRGYRSSQKPTPAPAAASPRHSPRIKKFHHEDDLLHTRRPKSHAGYRQDDRSQGVFPPFPEETYANKLENVSGRKKLLAPAANESYLKSHPEAGTVIVDRPGEPLSKSWFEQAPGRTSKGRVAAPVIATSSAEVAATLAGPAQRSEDPEILQVIERQHRVSEMAAGRGRSEPLTTDAPAPVESHLPARLHQFAAPSGAGPMPSAGRGGSWREAFMRFPREADGTVSVDNFVRTLTKLAGHGGATSADGRPGATQIRDADVARIVDLVDPTGSGAVTFARFAKAFAQAASDAPAARSLQLDGSGARTHSRAARLPAPAAPASSTGGGGGGGGGDDAFSATARDEDPSVGGGGGSVAPEEDGGDRGAGDTLRRASEGATATASGTASRRFLRGSSGPLLSAADGADGAAPAARRLAGLSRDITSRMHQIFGTHPSAFRKMFMRFARTADGTAGVADVAKGLRQAGLPGVSDSDVAALLGANDSQQRVSYDGFAHAVALTALTGRPPAAHHAAAAEEVARARALGAAALPQTPVGDEPRREDAPAAGARQHPEYYGAAEQQQRSAHADEAAAAAFSVPTESVLLLANTPAAQPHVQLASASMVEIMRDPLLTAPPPPGEVQLPTPAEQRRQAEPPLALGASGLASPLRVSRHVGMTTEGDKRHFEGVGAGAPIVPPQTAAQAARAAHRPPAPPEQVLTADALQRLRRQLEVRGGKVSDAFLRMDRQRDALLTPDEVRRGLERAGVMLDDAAFGRVYSLMDPAGAGAVDHAAFTRVLFPPDMHPDSKSFPYERGDPAPPRALGTRRRSVADAAAAPGPSFDMLRGAESGADDPAAAGGAPAGAPSRRGSGITASGGPSWLDLPTLDQAGLFTTARDASLLSETAHARRHFNLERPAPHLHGSLQPRDAWGTPAPYLLPEAVAAAAAPAPGASRRSSVNAGTVAALERSLTGGKSAAAASADVAEARRANALLRRVVDKLRSKGEPADVWMKLNSAHDGRVAVKELREGLARMGVHMSADEFRLFSERVDINRQDRIAFGEFARVLKGDDPIPDSFFYKAATSSGQPIAQSSLLAPGAPADALPAASFGQSPNLSRDPQSNPVVNELHYRKHRYAGPDPANERAMLTQTRQQAHDSSAVADVLVQDDTPVPPSAGLSSAQHSQGHFATSAAESGGAKRSLSSPPGTRRAPPRTPSTNIVAPSAAEAHLATDVSDRLYRRFAASAGGGARDVFVRLASAAGDASARVPSDPSDLRACLSAVGVEASQKQVEAFLRPVLGGPPLDFASFAALVQPRGYVDSAGATLIPADFVRKTNTARVGAASAAAPPPLPPTPGSVADVLAPSNARVPWATPAEAAAGVAAGTRLRAKSASGTARRPTQQERSYTGDAVRGLIEAPVAAAAATPRSAVSALTPRVTNPVLGDHDANPFLSTYRIASAAATQPQAPEATQPRGLAGLLSGGGDSPARATARPAPPVTPAGISSFRDPRSIQQQSRYVNLPPDAWAAATAPQGAAGTGRFGSESTTIDAPEAVAAVPRSERRRVPASLGRTFSSSIFSDPQYPSNIAAGAAADPALADEPRVSGYSTRPLPRGRARSVEPGFSTSRKRLIPGVEEARGVITDAWAARAPPPPEDRFVPGYTGFRSAVHGRSASVDAVMRRPSTAAPSGGAGVSTSRQPSIVAVSSAAGARSERKHYRTVQVRSDGVWDALAPSAA